MNINKFVNLFSIVAGVVILILGLLIAIGITSASPSKSGFLFLLGGIILVWGIIQKKTKHY